MIIDVHTHVFPDEIASRAVSKLGEAAGIEPVTDGTLKMTLEMMDRAGVDRSVLVSVATKPSQSRSINKFLRSLESERFIPFGAVFPDPENEEYPLLEETEYISNIGLHGIKLHPEYQGFYPDDERLFSFYELCSSLELPLLFHAGADIGFKPPYHGLPERFAKLAKSFPKLKVICAHFGGWCRWDEVEAELCGFENVFFDTAFCADYLNKEAAERIINKKGADNIMLGSDIPWEDPKRSIEFIDSLRIKTDDKEAIFGKNAMRIIGC